MVKREDCFLGGWIIFMFFAITTVIYVIKDAENRWRDMTPSERATYYKMWYKSRCCNAKGRCDIRGSCYDFLKVIFDQNKIRSGSTDTSSRVRYFIDTVCPRKYVRRRDRYETYCGIEDIDKIVMETS